MNPTLLDTLQEQRDGRNVSPEAGLLEGEASSMQVKELEPQAPVLPVRTEAVASYYGQPVVKDPVWIWSIPIYFYVGGAAGAAALLAAALDVGGGSGTRRLAHRCRALSAAGDILSAGLLIHDLGKPSRFLNMLRVFRITSPMSVGSWTLAASGACSSLAFVLRKRKGWLGKVGDAAGLAGAPLGVLLAGYTGVLIANTAVPLWQRTRRTLPLLFMASGVASAGALLELMARGPREWRVAHAFGIAGRAGELVLAHVLEREAAASQDIVRPLRSGRTGRLWTAAKVVSALGLLASLLPGRRRSQVVTATALTTAGALLVRAAIFYAGKRSAREPEATLRAQRDGFGAAEVIPPGQVAQSVQAPFSFRLPVVY